MKRLTKITIFLIFNLFLFYMVEQNIMLYQQTHSYATQPPIENPIDFDNLITEDTEPIAEEALAATTPLLQRYSVGHKITMAIKHRSLVTVISKHWEPPK